MTESAWLKIQYKQFAPCTCQVVWILESGTAKQFVFLRIQVRANGQTKGLEWGWKQRARLGSDGFFSLASHALGACEARALRARKTLTPRFTDFFTDFEEKTDCFAVYWNPGPEIFACRIRGFGIPNPSHGIQNPTNNNWNLDSKIHCRWIQNPQRGIENSRLLNYPTWGKTVASHAGVVSGAHISSYFVGRN